MKIILHPEVLDLGADGFAPGGDKRVHHHRLSAVSPVRLLISWWSMRMTWLLDPPVPEVVKAAATRPLVALDYPG